MEVPCPSNSRNKTPQQTPPGTEALLTPKADHGESSYVGHGRLAGKKTLITGADSGIGRAVALAFAREGADVLISYLNEHEDAKETERLVKEAGRKAVLVPGDLADPAHCRAIVDRAVQEFGRIDVLVNNAAFQMTHESIDEIPDDEWRHTFAVNIDGDVPHLQGRGEAHGAGLLDHQHQLDQLGQAVAAPAGLRHHQGRDRQLHGRAGPAAGGKGHPRELGGAGADLDAADSVDHAAGGGGRASASRRR
jgi:hypothetical protein